MEISNISQTASYVEHGSSQSVAPVEAVKQSQPTQSVVTNEKREESGVASNEQIRKAVDQINKNAGGSEAIFGIHEDTNRVTIKIVDKNTKDVIKEYPAEQTLDMIAKVWEMAGIMVDEKR